MKRSWHPLSVKDGLRLYEVKIIFHGHKDWNQSLIVAAKSPTDAANIIRKTHEETQWIEEPIISGYALNVFMPESWWTDGV